MTAPMLLGICLCLVSLAHSGAGTVGRPYPSYCTTFRDRPGWCRHYSKCPDFNELIAKWKSNQPLTEEETRLKESSGCSTKQTFVCCEEHASEAGLELLQQSEEACGKFKGSQGVWRHRNQDGFEALDGSAQVQCHSSRQPGRDQFLCGAPLITTRFVVTAAHCVIDVLPVAARLGEHNITFEQDCRIVNSEVRCQPPHVDVGIEKVIRHEGYSKYTQNNDIALIKLSREVLFTDHIAPICLPLYAELQKSIQEMPVMRVTGWGRQHANGNDSDVPLEAGITRLPLASCSALQNRSIAGNQICASASLRDSCKGDSGGPLLYAFRYKNSIQRFVQIGIVSYGPEDCGHQQLGHPAADQTAVYTDLGRFIPWITQKWPSSSAQV
ncbi:serine protease grass-like [Drosophila madeirensis]|uniref:CLIP domain-containing serine protease n=1 Tax=Drosophila madeirensis TaxID=30013 RepID=A0AAU9GFJ7_DROMD